MYLRIWKYRFPEDVLTVLAQKMVEKVVGHIKF